MIDTGPFSDRTARSPEHHPAILLRTLRPSSQKSAIVVPLASPLPGPSHNAQHLPQSPVPVHLQVFNLLGGPYVVRHPSCRLATNAPSAQQLAQQRAKASLVAGTGVAGRTTRHAAGIGIINTPGSSGRLNTPETPAGSPTCRRIGKGSPSSERCPGKKKKFNRDRIGQRRPAPPCNHG